MNIKRVIIAGGRNFTNYPELSEVCDQLIAEEPEVEIVSGTANGADKLGEKYADENGLSVKQFPAKWDQFGKSAGPKRNAEMVDYADTLIAFWDGKSKGTENLIELAEDADIKVKVVRYK